MIEVEFRSRFSEEKYRSLKALLDSDAQCLGQDDKNCVYFIFPDRLLKVVHNLSKKDAKISLKMNRIGEGAAFKEMEFHFSENDFELAKELFQNLPLNAKLMEDAQQRVNYLYKGCEIALKYGKTWGYHLEIEKMIQDEGDQRVAEEEIRVVAKELGIELMTDDELKRFTEEHERKLV